MLIRFSKFNGTGNDFIFIDNRLGKINLLAEEIRFLCDRHFGIGADGLISVELEDGNLIRMRYYNSDGKEATMCGNGGRCLAAWAFMNGIADEQFSFIAGDGMHRATILENDENRFIVKLSMNEVNNYRIYDDGCFIHTGTPHFVKMVNDPDQIDVFTLGCELRYDERFKPVGANVDFISVSDRQIRVRTYEKGVENETLSCGTGIVASTIAAMLATGRNDSVWNVESRGGLLRVFVNRVEDLFKDVFLEGPADFVFYGEIELKR